MEIFDTPSLARISIFVLVTVFWHVQVSDTLKVLSIIIYLSNNKYFEMNACQSNLEYRDVFFHLEWNLSSPVGRVRLNFHILIVYSH